jgi:hypothetical protein
MKAINRLLEPRSTGEFILYSFVMLVTAPVWMTALLVMTAACLLGGAWKSLCRACGTTP